MAPRIHERTRDRISAVQVLYTSELTGKSPSELLDCGLCLVAREEALCFRLLSVGSLL